MDIQNNNLAIIGSGASGMLAAISAGILKKNVTIFEKNEKPGKKILITGNGRCNIANKYVSYMNYMGSNPKFVIPTLNRFTNNDTITFFNKLGLILTEEDNGKLFPRSNQAQSVIDVLLFELDRLGVKIKYNQKIKSINKYKTKFEITTYQNKKYQFDNVIIATGGKTYPKTGSTGDGYRFAESFGHKIITLFPVSTPFRIKSVVCNKLQGVKVNAEIKIFSDNKKITRNFGELLFTHLGVSAPAVLEASRPVSKLFISNDNPSLSLSINFFPEYNPEQLRNILIKRIRENYHKSLSNQFIGLLPKKIAPAIFSKVGINSNLKGNEISNKLIDKIVNVFTDYRESIEGVLGWDTAQFTAGGIDTSQVNPETLESKIVKGLYFCGEVLDIDGQSGGYNLQWAWSSGWVAGRLG